MMQTMHKRGIEWIKMFHSVIGLPPTVQGPSALDEAMHSTPSQSERHGARDSLEEYQHKQKNSKLSNANT
jgi:hypothetical protein